MSNNNSVTIRCRCVEYILVLDDNCRLKIFLDYNNPEEEHLDKQRNAPYKSIINSASNLLVIC